MSVMEVGRVRMVMVQRFVEMRMCMIPGSSVMAMHMVFFGVLMEVLMLDRSMVVLMLMPLGCEDQGPCKHHAKRNRQPQVRILAEYEK